MATTGKIAEVMFEKALDTYEAQDKMVDLVTFEKPDPATLQNSDNVIWKTVQQHAPIISGFDLTGQETDIIEETYPCVLGDLKNDFVEQRADDLRDTGFWERRGVQSGRQQATELNRVIAESIKNQGSLFYRSNTASGYDFVAEAQAIMNERQAYQSDRCFILNDRDTLKFASDLAGRQTLQGRPEMTWQKGQIGQNVAEFDVYTGSFLPNLTGGADPATTVTGDQSFKPEAGSVDATTYVVTNIDYREAVIPVAASAGYSVGDKVTISNTAVPVQSIGLADKNGTAQDMTFTITAIPDGTSLRIFPKPIAADDPGLTTLEAAYANIDTQILNGATVDRINTDALAKSNLFFDKSAVEVTGGTIPAELFAQFDGMKVISSTMSNGQEMYMVYDGQIDKFTFRFRIFTYWGVTISNPSNCGSAITF